MKKLSFILSTLLMSFAIAQTSDAKSDGYHAKVEERLIKKLNLTDAQKAEVEKIREKYRAGLKDAREKMFTAKKDLRESLKAPQKGSEYQAELLKKFETAENLKLEMQKNRFQMALEIRELLSEDQLQNFKGFDHKWKGKKHKKLKR